MYIYYPSCNFQKLFPQTAKKIRDYMTAQEDVCIAGCCHKTRELPREGDVIVTICMSCMRGLAETRPDIPGMSFFEFLCGRPDFPWPDLAGEQITVQDCFRARGMHQLQDAVRECLVRSNARPVEMPGNRDEETFDGVFLLRGPSKLISEEAPAYFKEYLSPYLTLRPEEEWEGVFREQAAKYTTRRAVCYCNTCCSAVRTGGADACHLAQLLFPDQQ